MAGEGRQDPLNLEFRTESGLHLAREHWTDTRIEAWMENQPLGHITISHVTVKKWMEELRDPVQFCRKIRGNLRATAQDALLCTADHMAFKYFHVDAMFVAYVKVEGGYRRQGIGTQLYLRAAQWAGENENLLLASSRLQQEGAKAVWAKLVEDPEIPTVQLRDGRWALDYRDPTKPHPVPVHAW